MRIRLFTKHNINLEIVSHNDTLNFNNFKFVIDYIFSSILLLLNR